MLNGRREVPGLDHAGVATLMGAEAEERSTPPVIRFLHGARIQVGAGHAGTRGDEVWLVRYDPTPHSVIIKAGENKGKTVQVRNVVQELVRLGSWSGRSRTYTAPKADMEGLKTVILVQGLKGGPIVAAART